MKRTAVVIGINLLVLFTGILILNSADTGSDRSYIFYSIPWIALAVLNGAMIILFRNKKAEARPFILSALLVCIIGGSSCVSIKFRNKEPEAQKYNSYVLSGFQKDSIATTAITKDFYGWYIAASKEKKAGESNPVFVQGKDGMTTLDLTKYIENLIKYSFSDSLIREERRSYEECIKNLEKIKYSDFKEKFESLDDFENAKCDFENYYRWTGGQEMCDGYFVTRIHMEEGKTIVYGNLFNYDRTDKTKWHILGGTSVTLIRQNNFWKILKFK